MTQVSTLSEFLLHAGTEYRVYDLGRGIRHLSEQTFLDIEVGKQPYPYPRQGHAWLGIVFWNKTLSQEHYIWFLKLPVDENAVVISASRDHFLQLVVEALDKETNNTSDTLSKVENPYNFTPNQHLLADFNAVTKVALRLPPSNYYQDIQRYLKAPSVINWQHLATQGIADFCSRLTEANNESLFIESYSSLPSQVKHAFLSSLEHYPLSEALVEVILKNVEEEKADKHLMALAIKALTNSQHVKVAQDFIAEILVSNGNPDLNVLTIIVARHWLLLGDVKLLVKLLEQAATISNDVCLGFYQDLVMLPIMRRHLITIMQNNDLYPNLTAPLATLKQRLTK